VAITSDMQKLRTIADSDSEFSSGVATGLTLNFITCDLIWPHLG